MIDLKLEKVKKTFTLKKQYFDKLEEIRVKHKVNLSEVLNAILQEYFSKKGE